MLYTLSIIDPTSLPVSQLLSAESLCAMDQFAIERKIDSQAFSEQSNSEASRILDELLLDLNLTNVPTDAYNELLAGIDDYIHTNFKVSYDELSSRLLDDISAALNFGSMAYRDAWQHARITHTHQDVYSHLRCKASYTKEQVVEMGAEEKEDFTQMSNWLGTVVIWQQIGKQYLPISTDLFMPNFAFEEFPEPTIGEVRFIGWKSFPTETSSPYKEETIGGSKMIYDSENLGYWVYPQGQTIDCNANEFKTACMVYAGNELATQFKVPELRDFIRLNPRSEVQNPLKKNNWKNGALLSHSHDIPDNALENQTFNGQIKFPIGFSGSKTGKYFHGSGESKKESSLELTAQVELISAYTVNDQQTSPESLDVETKPFHNCIPILLYVGRR